jgi:hypothetical protein
MAFMAPPASRSDEDRIPILAFNAKAGRLFFIDREQQPDGEWTTVKTDVTMRQPAFAVDFGRLETGWIYFSQLGPQFSMAFYGQPMPAQPDSPGNSAAGKALRFKAGFRVPVISQAIGGMRELRGNAGALINGMNELHTQYEESGQARAGKIPLVKMTEVVEVRSGQSSNFQPVFSIVSWVDRPATLGPRTVAPPGASPVPPTRAAATRMPPAPIRYTPPPEDRWDDVPPYGDEYPARVPAGVGAWDDSEIPF